jgi:serine/threonine protein phosphatase PrpC
LPGLDPRGRLFSPCQDLCFFSSNGESSIFGVFDGNGKQGDQISTFCVKTADKFFSETMQNYRLCPLNLLTDMLTEFQTRLKDPTLGFDMLNSGCCCVLVLIHKKTLYLLNVGNCRAVLGTRSNKNPVSTVFGSIREENSFLKNIAKKRLQGFESTLNAIQLTVEHVTDNKAEFLRILRTGGRMQQASDSAGIKNGPYRILKNYSRAPGITFTRSIGNIILEEAGVIAEPDTNVYELEREDEIIILGSSGLWAVISNEDAVNFVATYRHQTVRDVTQSMALEEINTKNCCIAQLLCEEARIRWLAMVENEDSVIDDICCVVFEFDQSVERIVLTTYSTSLEGIDFNALKKADNLRRMQINREREYLKSFHGL